MNILTNLDLFSVGLTIAGIAVLGFTIFFNNTKSVTNVTFFFFSLITILWSVINYSYYQVKDIEISFWLLRGVIFLGVWHALAFFIFAYVFPEEKVKFPNYIKYLLFPLTIIVAALNLSPFVFRQVSLISAVGQINRVENGPAIGIFGIFISILILWGIVLISIKAFGKRYTAQKKQIRLVLTGVILTFILIITFNFIFPAFLDNPSYIPLGALFIFPFIAFTSYAIYRHHLFNIKIAAVAFVAFILTIFSFFNIIYAATTSQVAINITFFIAVLIGSIILIQTILRETKQRESLEVLTKQLEKANENQVQLIHFITHQIKGFFTKSRDIFSILLEGDAGDIPNDAKKLIRQGFDSDTRGVAMVQDVLTAANIKSGVMKYSIEPFDLNVFISALVVEYRSAAEGKGLKLEFSMEHGDTENYRVVGDQEQLKQVFKNLIENSIKYTPKGSVEVSLSHRGEKVVFTVQDTGVGVSADDRKILFTQGGRGKDSLKVNVDSTGYGLYIAKGIIEAHHGRIWVESEGAGKGAQFHVELPAVK